MSSKEVILWRQRTKERLVKMFGGKCQCCGYNGHISVFDFHHLDPEKKEFSFGQIQSKAWDDVVNELKKCVMVCANCHREIHAGVTNVPAQEFVEVPYEKCEIRKVSRVKRICKNCRNEFEVREKEKNVYCSMICFRRSRK